MNEEKPIQLLHIGSPEEREKIKVALEDMHVRVLPGELIHGHETSWPRVTIDPEVMELGSAGRPRVLIHDEADCVMHNPIAGPSETRVGTIAHTGRRSPRVSGLMAAVAISALSLPVSAELGAARVMNWTGRKPEQFNPEQANEAMNKAKAKRERKEKARAARLAERGQQ